MSIKKAEKVKAIENVRKGRYVYCIIECGDRTSFGKIGIDDNEVYTIPYNNISAVVHDCPLEPYKGDEEKVKSYVLKHQEVIDTAMEKFSTVLPMSFDVIVKGEKNVKKWLKKEYEKFKEKLNKFEGKVEVGFQIFWDMKIMAEKITNTSDEIKKLREEMERKPKGMAYFYKMKIENVLKREMEKKADMLFREFYDKIRKHTKDIRVEKLKKDKDKQMLMNLSLLIDKGKIEGIGRELARIKETKGFDARFTGPWPPYSFV
ncbi:MAG: GvpL/GvpF family gas vesicle protein [archaeon]|nr:GvpL/GvpF family gas vesicle protein [archaeon]MCP8321835.1 GvpL/GvpF family gas vesicle protein [archaeon]